MAKLVTTGEIDHPMSTEELRKRIQKRKEYREKIKNNPPTETLPTQMKEIVPSKTDMTMKKIDDAMAKFFKKLDTIIMPKFFKVFSRFLLGAVIWVILGHFVPEFKEKIPVVYEIIDAFFWAVNGIITWGIDGLKGMFGFWFGF